MQNPFQDKKNGIYLKGWKCLTKNFILFLFEKKKYVSITLSDIIINLEIHTLYAHISGENDGDGMQWTTS